MKLKNAPRYMIVGWNPSAMDWNIYHWDYTFDNNDNGVQSRLKILEKESPNVKFSVLVNVHHVETHMSRDSMLELINGLIR